MPIYSIVHCIIVGESTSTNSLKRLMPRLKSIIVIAAGKIEASNLYIIIIHCLTSDLDPCWAYANYSLYICRKKTLFKKTP